MSLLLCFSGQIGSGKSSVSVAVARALGWRRTGFSEYLRAEVSRLGGDPDDRRAMQDLGQKQVEGDPKAFCCNVIAFGRFQPGEDFIIDGIRHVSIFDTLVALNVSSQVRLLFLEVGQATRKMRVSNRPDAQDFDRASRHLVEAQLGSELPQHADGIVDANQSFDRVVLDCLSLVQGWRHDT